MNKEGKKKGIITRGVYKINSEERKGGGMGGSGGECEGGDKGVDSVELFVQVE